MKVIQLFLAQLVYWKNIFLEVVVATVVAVISINNFNFSLAFLLFLLVTTLLRLAWNSAILTHGLGHAILIATLDRQPNALNLFNILEHRSIAVTITSLLPFGPIFLPGCDQQNLWIAAGDQTPWRIRIKATGGIGFNFLAIAIVWQFSSYSLGDIWTRDSQAIAFVSTFLNQTFLGANLLIILSSCSDIAALLTGVAEIFCCGNFGFLGQRHADDDPQTLLPERAINIFSEMGRETEIRGAQAGGGLVVATNRDNQTVFVGKKVVNRKRDNLTKSLETAFAVERNRAASSGIKPLESTVMAVWHYRFGTSGPPAVLETHWHEWMSARQVPVWQFSDGEWVSQLKNVNHRITHNGDFDAWMLFERSIGNTELGWWLERVLHTPNQTRGDSAKIAGMMDLLVTQGMWDASVRLAYQLAIATSIQSAFGGQKPAADAPNTAPSESAISTWAAMFEEIFVLYRPSLPAPNSPACSQYFCRLQHDTLQATTNDSMSQWSWHCQLLTAPNSPVSSQHLCRLERDILQATANDSSMSQWSWHTRVNFVRTAIHAFFHNDLYFATKMFMAKAEGSFGLVAVSTLEEGRLVLIAQGQPISIGFNRQDGYMVYASEPAAVDAVLLNLPESYRLDLDQKMGEIALVTAKDIAVYSMSSSYPGGNLQGLLELRQKCEVAPSDFKNRWISMTNHPYLPYVKYPENNTTDPIAADCREIPPILAEIRLSWQNSASLNRQCADYLVKLFCEKADKFEQKPQKMLRTGLTRQMQPLPSVDLLVTGVENSLWLGERFAQDLKIVFPWLNIRAISSNQVLEKLQYDFSSLQLGRDSIVLAITQSGQTFPTVQAINTFDELYRQNRISELFILTGELSSFLGSPVIQPKHSNTLRHNILVNGSGRRTSEPATVAVAAAQHTLTELLFYLAKQVKHHFPGSNPLGMTLTQESLTALDKMKDDFLDLNVVQIMGVTPTGNPFATSIRQTLIAGGRKWAQHILETPLAWGIHALYVAITVGWAIPFERQIPLAKTIWELIVWIANIPQDAFLLKIVNPKVEVVDLAIYIFGPWLWTLGLRYFQGRQLLARTGKRTLVIGDVPWVSQLLKSYVSKLFSLSYGIASVEIHGANPEDDLLHNFGHRFVRGTLLFLGVPDGRRGQKQKQKENAVIMTGKQADGVRNLNVGPEVVVMGANPEIARKGFSCTIVLEGNDEYSYFKDQNAEDQTALIEDLRESRFGAFERLLASYVFFWALAKKVALFPFLRYQHWKSQSRTKIMTTAAPVAGMSVVVPKQLYQPERDDKPEAVTSRNAGK